MPDMARFDPFSPTFDHPLLNSSPDYGSRTTPFRNRVVGEIGPVNPQSSFRERNKRLRSLEDERNQLIDVIILSFLCFHATLCGPCSKQSLCRIYYIN